MTAAVSPFRASLFLFWLPLPCVLSSPFLPLKGLLVCSCTAALWGAPATGTPRRSPSAQLPPRAALRDQSTLLVLTHSSTASLKQIHCGQETGSHSVNSDKAHWKVTAHPWDKPRAISSGQGKAQNPHFAVSCSSSFYFPITSSAIHLQWSSLPINSFLAALPSVDF